MENSHAIRTKKDPRLDQARDWLQTLDVDLQSDFDDIAGDASFRRYFRLQVDGKPRILMDDPPPGESVVPFMDVNQRLRSANLHAPEIVHADPQNGFLLLEDLGDSLYRELLNKDNVDEVFPELFDILKDMALSADTRDLPLFDARKLRRDMDLFPEWYLGHHRKMMPRAQLDLLWGDFCDQIIQSAQEQPQCFVHRDFHSCNLLKTNSSLRLYVVGHTDMTGKFEYNVALSLRRADAVVHALVNEYGIAAERLAGKGAGPLCPVGSNKDDNGRKLNRRVELVEM